MTDEKFRLMEHNEAEKLRAELYEVLAERDALILMATQNGRERDAALAAFMEVHRLVASAEMYARSEGSAWDQRRACAEKLQIALGVRADLLTAGHDRHARDAIKRAPTPTQPTVEELSNKQTEACLLRARTEVSDFFLGLIAEQSYGVDEISRQLRQARSAEVRNMLNEMLVRATERERLYRIAYEACAEAVRGG